MYVADTQRCYKYINNAWILLPSFDVINYSLAKFKNELIALGGYDLKEANLSKFILKFVTKWEPVQIPPLPTPRCCPGIACSDKYIVTSGGWTDKKGVEFCRDVEILDVVSCQWQNVTPIPFASAQIPTVLIANSHILLTSPCSDSSAYAELNCLLDQNATPGGCDVVIANHQLTKIDKVPNPSVVNAWNILEGPHAPAVIAVWNKNVLAFSGSKVYAFFVATKKWCHVSTLPLDEECVYGAVAVVDDKIMLIGGGKEQQDFVRIFCLMHDHVLSV